MNRRLRLYKQDPHCFWCHELTQYRPMPNGGKNDPEEATVDHVYSRLDPRRPQNPGKFVLAHSKCNQKRAEVEIDAMRQIWAIVAPVLLGDKVLTTEPDREIGNSFKKIWAISESKF